MSTGVEAGHRLEIGHVLFMDLVGYSKLLLDEQREQLQRLTEIVRDTEQVRAAEAADKLIRLPVGDGMALVFFSSPEAPVRCAIQISERLKQYPQLKLRMGIHSGPVNGTAGDGLRRCGAHSSFQAGRRRPGALSSMAWISA